MVNWYSVINQIKCTGRKQASYPGTEEREEKERLGLEMRLGKTIQTEATLQIIDLGFVLT